MTDKQIIIDGCDVSGCECYSEHCEGYCGWHTPCEGDTCPYKLEWALQQLKHKEQECESLRNLLVEQNDVMRTNELMMKEFGIEVLKDITTDDITVRSIKLIELQQECERLERIVAHCCHDVLYEDSLQGQLDQLKAENDELKKQCNIYTCGICGNKDECNKLKQTLTEIKEIATENSLAQVGYNPDWDIILQKISEVEDVR